jgi:hypothetical protein
MPRVLQWARPGHRHDWVSLLCKQNAHVTLCDRVYPGLQPDRMQQIVTAEFIFMERGIAVAIYCKPSEVAAHGAPLCAVDLPWVFLETSINLTLAPLTMHVER